MKIYITSKNGLVGKNLIVHNKASNYEIIATSHNELDLTDYIAVENYLVINKPDLIIHCAGLVGGIQANIKAPYDFFTENATMGINIIRAAKKIGIRKFLNLSSSCAYPRNYPSPLKEEFVLQGELEPTNEGYALAKLAILRMCEYLSTQSNGNYQYKTLIPCNLYGKYDKFSPKNSHMIPAVIRKIHEAKVANRDSVDLWGDGLSRREFMYAEDFADAVYFAIDNFDRIPPKVNIGLGYDYSVEEYYKAIAEVIGWQGSFVKDPTKPSGMKQKLVDNTLIKSLGWEAKHSLKDGIAKTYHYFLEEEL